MRPTGSERRQWWLARPTIGRLVAANAGFISSSYVLEGVLGIWGALLLVAWAIAFLLLTFQVEGGLTNVAAIATRRRVALRRGTRSRIDPALVTGRDAYSLRFLAIMMLFMAVLAVPAFAAGLVQGG